MRLFGLQIKNVSINFNWVNILIISYFISYGIFGARTPNIEIGYLAAGIDTLIVILSFLLMAFLARKSWFDFEYNFKINLIDVLIIFLIFLLLLILSFNQVQYSLFADEISYAGSSQANSIHLSFLFVNKLNFFDDFPFKFVVQFISFFVFLFTIIFIFFALRMRFTLRIFFFALAILLCRLFIMINGGNQSIHPPLELVPLFLVTTFLGISDLTFNEILGVKNSFFVSSFLINGKLEPISSILIPSRLGDDL